MEFTYEGTEYTFPNNLNDITLSQHIEWNNTFGAEFRKQRIAIEALPEGEEKDLKTSLLLMDEATRSFSFYSGLEFSVVEQNIPLDQVLNVYTASGILIAQEERELELDNTGYSFNDELYFIHAPNLADEDDLTLEQFRVIKKLAEYAIKLSEGDWTGMQALAAAYLRKEGQEFNILDTIPVSDGGSGQFELMLTLPMNIALTLAQYLVLSFEHFNGVLNEYLYDAVPEERPVSPEIPEENNTDVPIPEV